MRVREYAEDLIGECLSDAFDVLEIKGQVLKVFETGKQAFCL